MQTDMRFLVGSDRYVLDLPADFALRESRTVLRTAEAWRDIIFHPRAVAEAFASLPELIHLKDATAPSGVRVSIYEQVEPPPVRCAVWQLHAGVVYTGFNPGAYDEIDVYIDGVDVQDSDSPGVAYGPLFEGGDQRERGQRDEVRFTVGPGSSGHAIGLARLPAGRRTEAPEPMAPGWAMRTSGTPAGLLLWWAAPAAAIDSVDARLPDVASSVRRVA
jgi:hypothetical protein